MSSYSDAVLSHASLRVYYRMGEAAGTTLNDIGPNALNGTYAATGVTYGVASGIIGDPSTAVTFAGTTDTSTTHNAALNVGDGPFSIECWIKRSATQGVLQVLLAKTGGTGAYLLQLGTTNLIGLAKRSFGNVASSNVALTDTASWHHIVATKNGSARAIYLDGVDVTSLPADQTLVDGTAALRIGGGGGADFFPGSMDDAAIYAAVLTPAEVLEHYLLGVKNYFFASQTFTANGDFIPPAGVERVHVECRGAGGAGGTATVNAGGGGGGGAFAKSRNVTVIPGNSYGVVVGQGGTGAGPDSTFNSTTVVAKGGGVGGNGSAGGAGTAGVGATAAASTGQIKKSGGNGAAGTGVTTGGGGGGGAGDNFAGGNAAAGTAGAAGVVGGGAGGAGAAVPAAGAGNAPGGAGGGATATGARGNGARGVVVVSFVEVGVNTSVAAITQSEAIADTQTVTSIAAPTAAEALAETQDLTTIAALSAAEALAEAQNLTSIGSLSAAEALAQISDLTSVAAFTQAEAIADTPGDLTSVAVLTAAEALAQTDTLTTVAFLEGLEALADVGTNVTVAVFTANWQRISPGLSGTVYDSTGSAPVVGAQVLVFRDDTNALIATLTSDALGQWALDLDPAFSYWISGWKTGSPQVEDRTDRAIVPVETVVEVGT